MSFFLGGIGLPGFPANNGATGATGITGGSGPSDAIYNSTYDPIVELRAYPSIISGYAQEGYFLEMGSASVIPHELMDVIFTVLPTQDNLIIKPVLVLGNYETPYIPAIGSVSIGYEARTEGKENYALGSLTNVSGISSYILGTSGSINGNSSFILGTENNITGNNTYALGYRNNILSDFSYSFGQNITIPSGITGSFCFGSNGTAKTISDAPNGYIHVGQPCIQLLNDLNTAIYMSSSPNADGLIYLNGVESILNSQNIIVRDEGQFGGDVIVGGKVVSNFVQSNNLSELSLMTSFETSFNFGQIINDIPVVYASFGPRGGFIPGSANPSKAIGWTNNRWSGVYCRVIDMTGNLTVSGTNSVNKVRVINQDKDEVFRVNTSNRTVYTFDGQVETSDRNMKNTIQDSDLGLEFIEALRPVSYKFNNGTSGRTHYGLISQEIEELLSNINKSSTDFAGFCKEEKIDEEENPIPNEYKYALRYTEFIAPLIKAVQELSAQNKALTQRIEALENVI